MNSIYLLATQTEAQRTKVIQTLASKGFTLCRNSSMTVNDVNQRYAQAEYPWVSIDTTKRGVDLYRMPPTDSFAIGISQEDFNQMARKMKAENQPMPTVALPRATKYRLFYTKADGEKSQYTISNPIEEGKTFFKAYAFGKGVRTFIKSRVRKILGVGGA